MIKAVLYIGIGFVLGAIGMYYAHDIIKVLI